MSGIGRKYWWRTRRGFHLVRLALDALVSGFRSDASWFLSRARPGKGRPAATVAAGEDRCRPEFFLSFCRDAAEPGTSRFNGGEKALNNLTHLLRRKGYEAFMVTWDGGRSDWLANPAPTISLADFRERVKGNQAARFVTSWIDASAFLESAPRFYYWDMESAYSDRWQFPELATAVRRGRIERFAAFSRTIQACLMARFERSVELVPSLVDDELWKPDESRRVAGRVGYFDEGSHTEGVLSELRVVCPQADFYRLSGSEVDVLSAMQSCEYLVVLNAGKDALWGEGGPYTPHEALACGAIPLATDLLGVRESILDGFNGVVVERERWNVLAKRLASLLADKELSARMRRNGREHFKATLGPEARWPGVAAFLGLKNDV